MTMKTSIPEWKQAWTDQRRASRALNVRMALHAVGGAIIGTLAGTAIGQGLVTVMGLG